MTDDNDTRMEHPDELLAGYVDDTASTEERRAVEAHLTSCAQCREELALARMARSTLMTLPELEAPGLAAKGLEELVADELAERRTARQEATQRRRWQVSWAALAGVAAVLVALAVVPLVLNRGGGARNTAIGPQAGRPAAAPAEAANYPPVFDRSFDYDPASIQALARQLGADARKGLLDTNRTSGAPTPGPSLSGTQPQLSSVSASKVVRCAVQGTGLPAGTIPVYLETATYQGTPVYVVAVKTQGGNRPHLRVYAVSRQSCSFLYEADQPL